MNKLSSAMRKNSNMTRTENNAKTYRSTKSAVLDFFYLAPTRQGQDNTQLFADAFAEDPKLALKAALYLRDIRGGKGQRQTFRDILDFLESNETRILDALVPFVPEYGRWDDLLRFGKRKAVRVLIENQLNEDMFNMGQSKPVSLLGKWMPSENASSKDTQALATAWRKALGMTPRSYRKMLTSLRAAANVVEQEMSDNRWEAINYTHVPSRAMKLYRKAFYKHDPERFQQFVDRAVKGEVKIQSGTLYPHEIVSKVLHGDYDKTLEAMWNQLPNYLGDEPHNILVVVDTSSSMNCAVGNGRTRAIEVSVALGMYVAERNTGPFQNVIMTFNSRPKLVTIDRGTLAGRVRQVHGIPWGGSTNLQASFELLLRMAKQVHADPEEMPSNIVIITDGEFNRQIEDKTNFEGIQQQYARAGYEMPLVTFWNVNARNNQAPVTKDEKNVFLVSGFSAETIGKVLQAEKLEERTPMELMLQVLNSERYAVVDEFEL